MTFTKADEPKRGVWSEEEMCDVFPDVSEPEEPTPKPRRTGAHALAERLRREVNLRNLERAADRPHELTRGAVPSVIYAAQAASHGNFLLASYRRICAEPDWRRRLNKAHTAKRQARPTGALEQIRSWRELDAASSSDALLMNIFCYPRVLRPTLCTLLGVEPSVRPQFGYKPRVPLASGAGDTTEIDMRLGALLIEAKLTEADFQTAPMRKLERYADFAHVFDRGALETGPRGVEGYQLLRGVLAAHAEGARYCVLCDARRPDLHESWFRVMRAVRSFELQARLRLVTWQEIARLLPGPLQVFLADKYGVQG